MIRTLTNFVLPPNSHRRNLLRILKSSVTHREPLGERLNLANLRLAFAYRQHAFDCPICGVRTKALFDFPNRRLRQLHRIDMLRETLQCKSCFASMRQRTLAVKLLDVLKTRFGIAAQSIAALKRKGLGSVRILDTDNFGAISLLLRDCEGYVRCSYVPTVPWGAEMAPHYFNIDLQAVSFADASFDIVLTSDVMEHVRDVDRAHHEIHRVLAAGGVYVFNLPYLEDEADDVVLVDTSGVTDRHLCEPHIHGDPLTGGVLAYRIFGRSLKAKLDAIGFHTTFDRVERPDALIVGGDVFTAVKLSA